jgi:hypothetical protein
MSASHGPSDRNAAFTGLILGAIFVAIVVVAISKLTSKKFEAHEAPAATTSSAR